MNELFRKRYNPLNYHCVHFVIDAAKELYGLDYSKCFIGLTSSLAETVKTSRNTVHCNKRIGAPHEGCIVLMTYQDGNSHVGLYHQHRIFHLTENCVSRPTIEQVKLMFKRIRFYEPNLNN
jgi:hypothetical protein